jgi:protein ImuB
MFGGLHSPASLPSSDALFDLARDFTPRIETIDPALLLLDLHGMGRLWPSPGALGTALLEAAQARAIPAHLALSQSRATALLLARTRPGLTIITPGREAAALAPLPLALLDLPPERSDLFRRWGIATLGDLAALPSAGLAQRLGAEGRRLRRLAQGADETPIAPTPAPESFALALDLEWPVDGLEPLAFLLMRLLDPLCHSLRQRGRRALAMTLDLALTNNALWQRQVRVTIATAEARTWRALLLLDLAAHPPPDAIRRISLQADPAPARTAQLSLIDPAQPAPERLAETLGRLQTWTSAGRAGSPVLLDTHRPDAFAITPFDPQTSPETLPERPPRLTLRVFRPPRAARVIVQNGEPSSLASSEARGAIIGRAGPWKASGDWWDAAWSREEWDVD